MILPHGPRFFGSPRALRDRQGLGQPRRARMSLGRGILVLHGDISPEPRIAKAKRPPEGGLALTSGIALVMPP
jgi:hypothetical protein